MWGAPGAPPNAAARLLCWYGRVRTVRWRSSNAVCLDLLRCGASSAGICHEDPSTASNVRNSSGSRTGSSSRMGPGGPRGSMYVLVPTLRGSASVAPLDIRRCRPSCAAEVVLARSRLGGCARPGTIYQDFCPFQRVVTKDGIDKFGIKLRSGAAP
jgi:hypothetical protein